MGLVEMKELIKTLVANAFIATLVIYAILNIFARITYKKTHKNVKKIHKNTNKNVNIVFDIGDTSKMNLFEIKQAKEKFEKSLKGAF